MYDKSDINDCIRNNIPHFPTYQEILGMDMKHPSYTRKELLIKENEFPQYNTVKSSIYQNIAIFNLSKGGLYVTSGLDNSTSYIHKSMRSSLFHYSDGVVVVVSRLIGRCMVNHVSTEPCYTVDTHAFEPLNPKDMPITIYYIPTEELRKNYCVPIMELCLSFAFNEEDAKCFNIKHLDNEYSHMFDMYKTKLTEQAFMDLHVYWPSKITPPTYIWTIVKDKPVLVPIALDPNIETPIFKYKFRQSKLDTIAGEVTIEITKLNEGVSVLTDHDTWFLTSNKASVDAYIELEIEERRKYEAKYKVLEEQHKSLLAKYETIENRKYRELHELEESNKYMKHHVDREKLIVEQEKQKYELEKQKKEQINSIFDMLGKIFKAIPAIITSIASILTIWRSLKTA